MVGHVVANFDKNELHSDHSDGLGISYFMVKCIVVIEDTLFL